MQAEKASKFMTMQRYLKTESQGYSLNWIHAPTAVIRDISLKFCQLAACRFCCLPQWQTRAELEACSLCGLGRLLSCLLRPRIWERVRECAGVACGSFVSSFTACNHAQVMYKNAAN